MNSADVMANITECSLWAGDMNPLQFDLGGNYRPVRNESRVEPWFIYLVGFLVAIASLCVIFETYRFEAARYDFFETQQRLNKLK